jgi:hypothetical protein
MSIEWCGHDLEQGLLTQSCDSDVTPMVEMLLVIGFPVTITRYKCLSTCGWSDLAYVSSLTTSFVNQRYNMSTTASKVSCLPNNVLRQILSISDYATVLAMARTSKKWRQIIYSDNQLWKTIYERHYRLIDVERDWLEIFIHKLQRNHTEGDVPKTFATFGEEMDAKWKNIDWRLALKHRICTEDNWRKNRPSDVIKCEELGLDVCFVDLFDSCLLEGELVKYQDGEPHSWLYILPIDANHSGVFVQDRDDQLFFLHASNLRQKQLLKHPRAKWNLRPDGFDLEGEERAITKYRSKTASGQYIEVSVPEHVPTPDTKDRTCLWRPGEDEPYFATNLQLYGADYLNGAWVICSQNIKSDDSADPDILVYIQHLHTKARKVFVMKYGSCYEVQSQTSNTLLLLIMELGDEEGSIQWRFTKITCAKDTDQLASQDCASGIIKGIDVVPWRISYLYDGYVIIYGAPHDNLRVQKAYVARYNADVQHYLSSTSTRTNHNNDLTLDVIWKRDMQIQYVFPDLGCILEQPKNKIWRIIKIETGECIKSYKLETDGITMRIIGSLCQCRLDVGDCLVDILSGEIIRMLPRCSSVMRKTGGTFCVDANDNNGHFRILDYSSLSTSAN